MQPTPASVSFDLNGAAVSEQVPPATLLAALLRDRLGMKSVRLGCGEGVCGSCSILVDGRSMRSCLMLAAQADGTSITTVEGYAARPDLATVQAAFVEGFGAQCGFCTSGMMATVAEYLADGSVSDHGDPVTIRSALNAVACRCTGYQQIVRLVAGLAGER
ncbi:2Fe-2S iron-sulfur cluster binding domain-containing protein [Sphingomonas histidinilytica]|uniref:Carbon-monoxide dehydrogenase small subunit n=1 Tax=Rhizorhabdus histidinilytica TaxID=439228 RepID=A0A1T5CY59_9SPHN|nr:2Fe-2S iron-sulfur cluster-binding protein [Rhizorhabdus histidinilytica]MBO9376315.1 2Fe-2S iron-sulfur cluster binding domain-containing protein [Rhizorhabdus histidinilytica]SKB64283.1 carbon-monoxide dehydrogenase small subunit [Rhizorhabdus histidinilytica]